MFDLLERKVNWVVRSNGSDLIVVVGMNAWQPFDVFEGLISKVKVEFSFFTRSQFFGKKAGRPKGVVCGSSAVT
jgi:hypothetical protein